MDPKVRPDAIFDQWKRFSQCHAFFRCDFLQIQVVRRQEEEEEKEKKRLKNFKKPFQHIEEEENQWKIATCSFEFRVIFSFFLSRNKSKIERFD